MRYAKIERIDAANGPGIRVSLFVQGCRKHCDKCFNPETWDFNGGFLYTKEIEDTLIEWLAPVYIDGLSLLGGDPTEPENIGPLIPLMKRAKELYPNKTIWIYSGDVLENLEKREVSEKEPYLKDMLDYCDVLVDGPFIQSLKNLKLRHRGSENQRVIDMKLSRNRKQGEKPTILKGWE